MQKIIKPNVTIFGVDDDGMGKFPPYFLNRVKILQENGKVTVKDDGIDKEMYLIYFSPNLYGRRILLEEICGEDKNYNDEHIDREKATESFVLDMNVTQSPNYKIWVITRTRFFPLLQKKMKEMSVRGLYLYQSIGDICVTATIDTPTRFPMMLPSLESLFEPFSK